MSTVQWVNTLMIIATAMMLLVGLARKRADQIVPAPIPVDGQDAEGLDR